MLVYQCGTDTKEYAYMQTKWRYASRCNQCNTERRLNRTPLMTEKQSLLLFYHVS